MTEESSDGASGTGSDRSTDDPRGEGFRERTRLADARQRLIADVAPVEAVERVDLGAARGRVVAKPLAARRAVPHYRRAAMDGFAVRAADLRDATDRTPAVLDVDDSIGPNAAVPVHTGSAVPADADAVVPVEATTAVERAAGNDGADTEQTAADADGTPADADGTTDDGDGTAADADGTTTDHGTARPHRIRVATAVPPGENVAPVGEDVAEGDVVCEPGVTLDPPDLALLRSVGHERVPVRDRPTVAVVPTGEELVATDPAPGEVVETNGLTVATSLDRWGAAPRYRDPVTDDPPALRAAVQRDLTADAVVTTGGTSVGERDYLPAVLDDLGTVHTHGVAIEPGHPVALATVRDRPVVALPGYPVSTVVGACQLLRPLVARLAGGAAPRPPTTRARLTRKVPSEPGVRTFARVRFPDGTDGDGARSGTDAGSLPPADAALPAVEPVRTGGAGVLSSVTAADGWVVVPESREGLAAETVVAVQDWEWSP